MDEQIARYKALSLSKRLALCFFVGILPAAYLYYEQAGGLEEELAAAESAEKDSTQKLVDADNKLKNLEKTESELAFTTDQLKKAETRLPDQIVIGEILRNLGKSAKDSGVTITEFIPQSEIIQGDEYKYTEIPLKMVIEAHDYSQLCSWIDNTAGIKSKLYLKSWSLRRQAAPSQNQDQELRGAAEPTNEVERELDQAMRPRQTLVLRLAADFSAYRLATAGAAVVTGSINEKPDAKKTPPPPMPSVTEQFRSLPFNKK